MGILALNEKKIGDFIAFNEEFKAGVLNKDDMEVMLGDFGSLLNDYVKKLKLMG